MLGLPCTCPPKYAMLTGMGCPAATRGGQVGKVIQISIAGGAMPTEGMTCGLVGAERTQPSPVTSNALLLHRGCTAKEVWLSIGTLLRPFHAHLSPFSLP